MNIWGEGIAGNGKTTRAKALWWESWVGVQGPGRRPLWLELNERLCRDGLQEQLVQRLDPGEHQRLPLSSKLKNH